MCLAWMSLSLLARLSGVPKEKQAEEGIKICVEMIHEEIPGVRGVHIMAIEWEEKVAEIAKAGGFRQGPIKSHRNFSATEYANLQV